jgi:hypothetical protein
MEHIKVFDAQQRRTFAVPQNYSILSTIQVQYKPLDFKKIIPLHGIWQQ